MDHSVLPLWLHTLRVLDFTVFGVALTALASEIIRMARLVVTSSLLDGRKLYALTAFGYLLFLVLDCLFAVGLTERVADHAAFNWRDWTYPGVFTFVILYVVLVRRTELSWNPSCRKELDSDG